MRKRSRLRLISYIGNKFKHLDIINSKFNSSTNKKWFEPFLGSGAVLFNLEKEYDEYLVNDLNSKIILIMNTFKDITYKDYKDLYTEFMDKCGDITDGKKYYPFRNEFNKAHYNKGTVEEGIGTYILSNSCINSMMRFGPRGFNQSCGGRYRPLLEKEEFDLIQSRLKRCTITNMSFANLDLSNIAYSDVFLDPPYILSEETYGEELDSFLEPYVGMIENLNSNPCNRIVGTDIMEMLEHFDFSYTYDIIRTLTKVGPHSKTKERSKEIIYTL